MELGIALCKRSDNNCPRKDECLRFTQITGEYDFINFENILNEHMECDWFWKNEVDVVAKEEETKEVTEDTTKSEVKEETKTDNQ